MYIEQIPRSFGQKLYLLKSLLWVFKKRMKNNPHSQSIISSVIWSIMNYIILEYFKYFNHIWRFVLIRSEIKCN